MLRSFGWTKNNDGAEKLRFDYENGRSIQSSSLVAFRTQLSTRFVTGELRHGRSK